MFSIRLADHIFNIDNKYAYVQKMYKAYTSNEALEALISVTETAHLKMKR